MKNKRIKKFSLGALLLIVLLGLTISVRADGWTCYQNSSANNGVTAYPAPTDADHSISLWSAGMQDATTPPLVIGDKVYTASGRYVYCFDKKTGEKLGSSDKLVGEVGFALHPMVYANNMLYVTTDKGGARIEALSLSDPVNPKVKWSSSPVSGTCYSPLTYHNGYLYTGTWNGEASGYYFCVSASNGNVVWSIADPNGFYWDGAYASDNYVAFASENAVGGDNEAEGSVLYTVNARTGARIDAVTGLKGSIRNTVVYDNGYLYVGTVAGRLYRIRVDAAGHLGKSSGSNNDNFSYIDLEGRIKATMVIDKGQLYVGVEGKGTAPSYYYVIDCTGAFSGNPISGKVVVPDEPKGAPIVSTAESGTRYVYFTCNVQEGGIYYFTNTNGRLSSCKALFTPAPSQQGMCISSLALDSEGNLYYKNDSNYLMAVSPRLIRTVEITPTSGIHWKNQQFSSSVRDYSLTSDASVSEIKLNVKKLEGDADVSFQCVVNGKNQGSNTTITLGGETTAVELKVTRKAITLSYTFTITKKGSQNTSLGLLYYGKNYTYGGNLLPSLVEGKTEYTVDLRTVSANDAYLWIMPEETQASVEVYAVENIKDAFATLKNGDVLDPVFEEKTGERKYDIIPADSAKNTVLRVRVTSADNSKYKDYQLKFIRTEEHQHAWSSTWSSDAGYHWHECAGAGAACEVVNNSQKAGYGAHTGSWVVTQSPTCSAEGIETYRCTVCGYTVSRGIGKSDHTFGSWVVTQSPTCSTEGIETNRCTVCGYTVSRGIGIGGHTFGPWVQSAQATVTNAEVQKRSCNVCGFTEEKIVGDKIAPILDLPGNLKTLSIKKGATAKFTLTMATSDSVVSVTSGNAKYVKVVSFQRTGAVSLKAVKKGKTTVTVSLGSGLTRTYTVNVVTGTVKTTNIKVDNTKVTLAKNKTMALRPVVTPFTSTQKITYKSSNKKVATVTSAGKIKGVAPGSAKITITSGNRKAVVTVNVAGISLSKTSVKVKRNKTFTLKTKRYGISDPVTYISSNTNIATVTANGKIKGIKKGTATITVKAGAYSVKCKVKVK